MHPRGCRTGVAIAGTPKNWFALRGNFECVERALRALLPPLGRCLFLDVQTLKNGEENVGGVRDTTGGGVRQEFDESVHMKVSAARHGATKSI